MVLVLHDWGSALGFDWANQHRDRVQGIAFMEAIVTPMTWADWPPAVRGVFQGFRSPQGEPMALEHNIFVERVHSPEEIGAAIAQFVRRLRSAAGV
ncbi:haloalkane dehalogenase DHAA (1-chlorohexane halidohydrolase) [Mycobacterium tuberculosis]|nr:haloalkane dehalogenase DHAA (1-chlorohexane halidohydrolase) [Mycobacterium tuberculosis]